ncbi:MAG: NADPH:quinone oxidoreductase [Actinobacteria bacterium HGW-Actinobacteria-4]|nr:MAG: NADPH:quinone oxidoreductase [Actinobacteria bacterium HGW-Actinobacteria-4]
MKVAVLPHFGGPESFKVESALPPVADRHEVVIAVAAAGVNRADVLQRQGHYPAPPGAPAWPGLEVSGTIAATGSDVARWNVGDRVCALLAGGGYAELVTVAEDLVLPAPPGLPLVSAGGLVEAACTVWSNLRAADAAAGQTLLVHGGSGGVGTTAIQIGKALGMRVVVTAGGAERAQRCRDLGADVAIDYHVDDFVEAAQDMGGADVIVDVVGAAYLERNIAALAPDGTLVVIGLQQGSTAPLNLATLLAKRARVIGTTLRSRPHDQKAAIVAAVERDVWPWVPRHLQPVIHRTYALDDVVDAHREMDSGAVFGKLILTTEAATA